MKIAVASALLFSSAMAHQGHGPHGHRHAGEHAYRNKPHSHIAYHHVEQACTRDIETFCTAPSVQSPLLLSNVEWAFPSERELMEIAHTMDLMMESFFSMPPSREHVGKVTIYTPEMIHQSPKRATVHDLNFVADSTASELASQTKLEEIPQLAQKLNQFGEQLMASSQVGRPDHHIGRRLTEMDAGTLHSHLQLPFGSHKNACLMQMLPLVSKGCQTAVKELDNISYMEHKIQENQESQAMYVLMYLSLLMIFLALVVKKTRMDMSKQHLGHSILEAIYANPKLKRQVEREMGQSVGKQAPVPVGRKWREESNSMRRMRFFFFLALFYAFLFAPLMILPVCVMAMFFRVMHMCVIVNNPDDDEEDEEEEDDLKKPLYTPPTIGEGQKHTFESEKIVVNGVSVTIV